MPDSKPPARPRTKRPSAAPAAKTPAKTPAKTAAKTATRPAVKPAVKQAAAPAVKPAAKPVAKPAVPAVAKPVAKPVARPVAPRPAPAPAPAPAPRRPAARVKATRLQAAVAANDPSALQSIAPHEPPQVGPNQIPVFQIHFDEAHRVSLDPDLIPYDNAGRCGPLREFEVFERLAADEGVQLSPLWGAVSWKFFAKTGLSGEALAQAVHDHPGCDLYYCNPSPEHEALFANFWHQGLTAHPGLRDIGQAVFAAAGVADGEFDLVMPSSAFSSCNYFVAGPAFWRSYLPFVRGIVDRATAGLPEATRLALESNAADPRNLHAGSSYWPFIVERLLPLYLRGPGAGLKTHKIALPTAEARLNPHLRRLREMKDVAHRTRSQWLYSCWLHFRNLYLLQTAGRDWCTRYLPQLNPSPVVFW